MPTKVKVSGAWKDVSKISARVSGAWKECNGVYVKVSGIWKQVHTGVEIPAGLIIPYNGESAPSGWSLFSSANNKYIIGAGNKSVGATGGSITVSGTTNTTQHEGGYDDQGFVSGNGTGHNIVDDSHYHTFSFTYAPNKRRLVLIKANAGNSQLPANGFILTAEQSMSGLTQLYAGENRFLYAHTSVDTEDDSTSKSVSSSTDGSHNH